EKLLDRRFQSSGHGKRHLSNPGGDVGVKKSPAQSAATDKLSPAPSIGSSVSTGLRLEPVRGSGRGSRRGRRWK
ncbi:hypothetical protein BX616_009651, partial [Lobosporangium transversale]